MGVLLAIPFPGAMTSRPLPGVSIGWQAWRRAASGRRWTDGPRRRRSYRRGASPGCRLEKFNGEVPRPFSLRASTLELAP